VESDDSAGTDQLSQRAQDRKGIGKKHQNETAHHGVKWFVGRDLRDIGLGEGDILQASLGYASSGMGNSARVALYAHYFSRRTNQLGRQHGHVSNAGTDVQDALARANACVTEESFGEGSEALSLPNEALVFRGGAAEGVVLCGISGGHDGRELYHRGPPQLPGQFGTVGLR
jgi:hypothetical protein